MWEWMRSRTSRYDSWTGDINHQWLQAQTLGHSFRILNQDQPDQDMCVNEIPTSHFTIYTILIHFHNPDMKINLCNTDYPEDLCSQMLINLRNSVFLSQRERINYVNVCFDSIDVFISNDSYSFFISKFLWRHQQWMFEDFLVKYSFNLNSVGED